MGYIRLVVFKEHTLGYILPDLPDRVQVLHQSILKGATFKTLPDFEQITSKKDIRLASEKDFEEYRVCMDGYKKEDIFVWQK